MKQQAIKKCKSTGRAIDYVSCGEKKPIFKYGMCYDCYKNWLFTDEGKKLMFNTIKSSKKKEEKRKKSLFREEKEKIKRKGEWEMELQVLVNAIARLLDHDKGCISCGHGWNREWTRQKHGGHFMSVGSNSSLRFNVFNIRLQCSICNNWKSANQDEYRKGLIRVYGQEEMDYIDSLPVLYPILHLSIPELQEAIKKAKEVKKNILSGKDYTRKEVNEIIGIYDAGRTTI